MLFFTTRPSSEWRPHHSGQPVRKSLCRHLPPGYRALFGCLDARNAVSLLALLLTEKKVLLTSRHAALVVEVAEGARHLLFPFKWCHCYLPRLPLQVRRENGETTTVATAIDARRAGRPAFSSRRRGA